MIIYTTCSEATFKACFGCNDQAFWIGIESLGDQALTDVRPVRIGRVDEIDAQFECPTQYPDDFIVISRFSPNPIACNSHGPEPKAVYGRSPPMLNVPLRCAGFSPSKELLVVEPAFFLVVISTSRIDRRLLINCSRALVAGQEYSSGKVMR